MMSIKTPNYAEKKLFIKVLKKYKRSPCLWDVTDINFHKKEIKSAAWAEILKIWQQMYPKATQVDMKTKICQMRANYGRQRKRVESNIGTEAEGYKPTLWYYEHLNFLSGGNGGDDQSDSDTEDENETVYVQIPPTKKKKASEEDNPEPQPNTSTAIVEASAAAFGQSVGAQLQHLSKIQRCIAEKLISDIIYHGKMENLTMNSSVNLNVEKNPSECQTIEDNNIVIPKSEPSWYDTVHSDSSQQESSSSCTFLGNAGTANQIDDETQSAVNCIKFELEESDTTFHITQTDLNEQTNAISIVKTEGTDAP